MVGLHSLKRIICDESADAVVEATILFPIIIMIFFSFILLAIYLPSSVALQRSVQKAALIASAQRSDLGYVYDVSTGKAGVNYEKLRRENVYAYMFRGLDDEKANLEKIVGKYAAAALYTGKNLQVSVEQDPHDKRYIIVTAEQTLAMPFSFPFLSITDEITLRKSARSMNRDADEFIRSMDIVYDLVIRKSDKVKKTLGDISDFFDIFSKVRAFFRI